MTGIIVAAGQSPGNICRGKCGDKEQSTNKNEKQSLSEKKIEPGRKGALSFSTAHKMIQKFLTCDRMCKKEERCLKYTKEELAEKLGINQNEFEKLKVPYFYKSIVNKITFPLVRLYCATKLVEGKYKGKQ